MDILFFFTDRFPYGKGEAFIENEVPFIAERFDRVYVIPTALTADISIQRDLPQSFIVLPPANTDNLYSHGRPSRLHRLVWSLKYMLPWSIKTFFVKAFWNEVFSLLKSKQLRLNKVEAVIRIIAPTLRNEYHFGKLFKDIDYPPDSNYYLYSYWFNNYPCSFEKYTKIKRNSLKTIVARAHGIDLYTERHSCNYIPLRKESFDALDHLVLISEDGYNYITKRYPAQKDKCSVSRLGTQDYGIGPACDREPFIIASCSSVIPVKRVYRIVDALSMINDHRIHWIHFGAGQDFEKLRQYSEEHLRKNGNISYDFKGQFLNKDLMSYYKTHSISLFLNVSESEGIPVSIMEAISFGIPVVATNVGGTSEAFRDKSDEALLKIDFCDEDLVAQIKRFYEMDASLYHEKRSDARNLWEERFNGSYNYQKFLTTFFK